MNGPDPVDPSPLTPEERVPVDRWHRWMRAGLVVALVGLAVWVGWILAGEPPGLAILLPAAGTAIVAFGLIVVFGGRCPRCGARLQAEAGLRVPARCRRCRALLRA